MKLPKEFWDIYMRVYAVWMPHFVPHRALLGRFVEKVGELHLPSNAFVMDLGCGPGLLIRCLLESDYPGYVYGLDALPSAVAIVKDWYRKHGYADRVLVKEGDLDSEDVLDTFPAADVIASVNVLYALKDPEGALARMARRLKPGGSLVISTLSVPDVSLSVACHERWLETEATEAERAELRSLEWARKRMLEMNEAIARAARGKMFHVWSEDDARAALEACGLQVESVETTYAGTAVLAVAMRR